MVQCLTTAPHHQRSRCIYHQNLLDNRGAEGNRMQAVDGKQEINLEWPNSCFPSSYVHMNLVISNDIYFQYSSHCMSRNARPNRHVRMHVRCMILGECNTLWGRILVKPVRLNRIMNLFRPNTRTYVRTTYNYLAFAPAELLVWGFAPINFVVPVHFFQAKGTEVVLEFRCEISEYNIWDQPTLEGLKMLWEMIILGHYKQYCPF